MVKLHLHVPSVQKESYSAEGPHSSTDLQYCSNMHICVVKREEEKEKEKGKKEKKDMAHFLVQLW